MSKKQNKDIFDRICKELVKLTINEKLILIDESEIKGIEKYNRKKPDFLALDNNEKILIIGEIKRPKEKPTFASWRNKQLCDTTGFIEIRNTVRNLENKKVLTKEVGGHIIILLGQIPDYMRCLGVTYKLPWTLDLNDFKILLAYCFPVVQLNNVINAIKITGINRFTIVKSNSKDIFENEAGALIYRIPYEIFHNKNTDQCLVLVNINRFLKHLRDLEKVGS